MTDTIYALASGSLPCAIAVIRISGAKTTKIINDICQRKVIPKKACYTRLIDKQSQIIDEAIVIYMPKPNSFTGQDYAELQVHGSKSVIAKIFEYFNQIKKVRQAEPGEFTRIALQKNKINITQVEALQDLMQAETEAQRKQAAYSMSGELEKKTKKWRKKILHIRAIAETEIDFAENDQIENHRQDLQNTITKICSEIKQEIDKYQFAINIRQGVNIVLAGETNSGKSSLINALTKQDIAIVSKQHGTTRDVIETYLDIKGYPAKIYDTAGIRKTRDYIEKIGIDKTRKTIDNAHIILYLIDNRLYQKNNELTVKLENKLLKQNKQILVLFSKADLVQGDADKIPPQKIIIKSQNEKQEVSKQEVSKQEVSRQEVSSLQISVKQKYRIDNLIEILKYHVEKLCGKADNLAIRLRHKQALQKCMESLAEIKDSDVLLPAEIIVEKIRQCETYLDTIVGKIETEQVLDEIFSHFCIGK